MSLVPTPKNCDPSVRQAIQKLALKLGPTSEPTFAGLTPTGLTASRLVATDADKKLVSTDIDAWIAGTTNQVVVTDDNDGTVTLSLPQNYDTGATPTLGGLTLVNAITEFSTDDTLGGDSDSAVPTEQAVKAYVDGLISGLSSTYQPLDDVLTDLAALTAVADNEFIVGTGVGVYAHESGATARTSLGLGTANSVEFGELDIDTINIDGSLIVSPIGIIGFYSAIFDIATVSEQLVVGTTTKEGTFRSIAGGATTHNWNFFDCYSDDATYATYLVCRKSNSDTPGTKTTTVINDIIGNLLFQGVDSGGNFDGGAAIQVKQTDDAGVRVPCKMNFYTYSATTFNLPQLTLDNAGNVGINDETPVEKLDVNGNINLTGVLKIDDTQVVKEQQVHIADAPGDTAANNATTINAILTALETHGLLASA